MCTLKEEKCFSHSYTPVWNSLKWTPMQPTRAGDVQFWPERNFYMQRGVLIYLDTMFTIRRRSVTCMNQVSSSKVKVSNITWHKWSLPWYRVSRAKFRSIWTRSHTVVDGMQVSEVWFAVCIIDWNIRTLPIEEK